ncbi:MAG: hypothetical protein ACI8RZ_001495 [Myxococcota bacterium]
MHGSPISTRRRDWVIVAIKYDKVSAAYPSTQTGARFYTSPPVTVEG